ncbi:hypothetical protein GEV33_008738 [Tenebrio molitor]|uniref:DDE-1 domain-containing protein n=1 Tax=Tenebrio molitor TaxID=7067 RepID=A0A8J6HGZ0_TENMO|nr:hypothetical protein GEV33_008738 [Tenebrio molitor]
MKIRRVADDLGFSFSSLQRHVKKAKSLPVEEQDEYEANSSSRQVFNAEREKLLCEYLQTCSKMHYGLDTKQTRVFAYEFAKRLGIAYLREWNEHKSAGRDWLLGFMDRNKDLSLRQLEATSLGRSTSFNKHNVGMFFKNLKFILDKHKFSAENIFNLDETGCTTVHKPSRVIAMKGQKQVGQPPAIVFPLKRFKDHMIMNAPENTLGLACSSGWMTKENFVLVMEHFIKYSGATRKNPCLLLLDNHESHVNLDVVSLAKSNGVHLLTFPPHCSHRLQPLDVSVYGPFKAYYNGAASAWMTSNPEHEKRSPNHTPEDQANITLQPDAVSTTAQPRTPKIVITSDIKLTPEMIRPFPKAKPRKVTNKGRKPGKTRILTETPEKEELERQENKKMLKTRKSAKRNVLIDIDESEIAKQQKQSLKTKTLTKRRKKSEKPNGLSRDDGKRPDGMTLVPWIKGQPLVWDVTVVDTLADSYVLKSSEVSGFAAEMAYKSKHSKYSSIISSNYVFKGLAFETLGPWCKEAIDFINVIGNRLIAESGDSKSKKFLFEGISLAIQRGNAASIRGTFPDSAILSEIFVL